jgi:hypothetical protein
VITTNYPPCTIGKKKKWNFEKSLMVTQVLAIYGGIITSYEVPSNYNTKIPKDLYVLGNPHIWDTCGIPKTS